MGIYDEKKSVFNSEIYPLNNLSDFDTLFSDFKKKYSGVKHYVYAYRVMIDGNLTSNFSDAGEPSRTAGYPILKLLEAKNLVNVVVFVARKFGGILLGSGGLVRAYSNSAKDAIDTSSIIDFQEKVVFYLEMPLSDFNRFNAKLISMGGKLLSKEFTDVAKLEVEIDKNKKNLI